jgi:hypothetical protein
MSRSSSCSKSRSLKNLEKVSTGSVCGSSMCSDRPGTATSDRPGSIASDSSVSSDATWTNRSAKTDGSTRTDRSEAGVDRIQLDSKCSNQKFDIPALDLNKKRAETAEEPQYKILKANEANISVFSRHIG